MKTCLLVLLISARIALAADQAEVIRLASEDQSLTPRFQDALKPFRAEVNGIRDGAGRALLHCTVAHRFQARTLTLLLANADVNVRDAEGRTPVFYAINDRDEDDLDFMMLEMLAIRGADLDARAKDGTTPLAKAVEKGDYRKVEFLIWRGAAVKPLGIPPERLPMSIAIVRRDSRMIKLLNAAIMQDEASPLGAGQASGASALPTLGTEISAALEAADLNGIESALAAGWKIDEQDDSGSTALYRAVQNCRPELAALLLFEGANPNVARKDGRTALMESTRYMSTAGQRMTALLLLRGADVNASALNGETPLTCAAAAYNNFAVQPIVWAGADVTAKLPHGSVTDYTTYAPTLAILEHFGAPAPQPKATEKDPGELLCAAARSGDIAALDKLLAQGISPEMQDKRLRTPFVWAVFYDQFDVVDDLLKHGVSINSQSPTNGDHILHSLLTLGVTEGNAKATAQIIDKLFKRGANPNIQKTDGTTPLMCGAQAGNAGPGMDVLIKAGALLNLRDHAGLTALGIAEKFGRSDTVAYLKTHGAKE